MAPRYSERLHAPWQLWGLALALAFSLGTATLPVGPGAALAATAVGALLCTWGLLAAAATVEVGDGELRAGRARIPLRLLGAVTPLDAGAARRLRGPGIDPSAYHLVRGWVPEAVRVAVLDPEDPTPYWYVATRRPRELAEAIEAARADGVR